MLADAELQRVVYERASGDSELALIMGHELAEFYDYVPEDAVLPYISYQLIQSDEDDTTTTTGFVTTFALHVWSQAEGSREAHRIMQRLYQLFHLKTDFTLELYRLINLTYTFSEVLRDPDGQTYHGVIRFRAVLDSLETEAA